MEITQLYRIYLSHPQITTDSRTIQPGSIFFALKGEKFNGNQFAAKALDDGCSYAVIDQPQYAAAGDNRYILVDNTLQTLQQLAHHHRQQTHIPVIQITGTNGKTTTKELIAAVLKKRHNVLYTQGNLNNHIGVPLTLLRLTTTHTVAVIETGANHPGEIQQLSNIVNPDYGIITNVGMAHLQGFGSLQGVIQTKGELYDKLRTNNGTIFIDAENNHLTTIAHNIKQITYGHTNSKPNLFVQGHVINCTPFLHFAWQLNGGTWNNVQTHIIGAYNLQNMLAAAAVGTTFGVTQQDITTALADYQPQNGRSLLTNTPDNTLIVDAYNANPTSMRAAIENFNQIKAPRRMAIIGDMGELGQNSPEAHQEIVNLLTQSDIENVWLVGPCFAETQHTFRQFKEIEQVKQTLRTEKPKGYTILIKGSHSTKLYQLPQLL